MQYGAVMAFGVEAWSSWGVQAHASQPASQSNKAERSAQQSLAPPGRPSPPHPTLHCKPPHRKSQRAP